MRSVILAVLIFGTLCSSLPVVQNRKDTVVCVVDGLDSFKSVHDLVLLNDVRGLWRESALLVVHESAPVVLPKGATISHEMVVLEGNIPVIALDSCTPEGTILHVQKDGTCVVATSSSYEDLDDVLHRENILPTLSEKILPQRAASEYLLRSNVVDVDNRIIDLIKQVSMDKQLSHLKELTHGFNTRLSSTQGLRDAGVWLKSKFEEVGLQSKLVEYSKTYGPVVEAIYPGEEKSIVIIGAHLDDRSKNINDPAVKAPGANDDGSGIAMLVELAHVVAKSGLKFKHTIHFMAFTGEEQGLYGSTAYAESLLKGGVTVATMLQGDMLAVKAVGKVPTMAIAVQYSTKTLVDWIANIAKVYVPDLKVEKTDSCCTDQLPFFQRGFPAIAVNEGGGYLIDPMYHTTGDVVERADYSIEQLTMISRVLLAALSTAAEIQ